MKKIVLPQKSSFKRAFCMAFTEWIPAKNCRYLQRKHFLLSVRHAKQNISDLLLFAAAG